MSRLKDVDALHEYICSSIDEMTKIGVVVDGEYLWGLINDGIKNAPSINLVHCGECKYCEKYESMEGMEYICGRIWCSPYDWADRPYFYVSLDSFCSYGERKESE